MELPREYISYSQIRTYQTCPKKYYYSYIEKRRSPINEKIFLGVVFHSVVEFFLNEKICGREPDREALIERFKTRFEKDQHDQEINWTAAVGETRKRGVAFIHYFLKEIAPELKPMMVEKELSVDIPELGIPLKGVLDLVETDFSISDFKTTTAKWSKTRIHDAYLQMQIYRFLFEKSFGNVIGHLRFRILYAKNPTSIKDQKISVKASDLDGTKMFEIIKYVVENIRKEVFYKNETYNCGFCEFRSLCKAVI